MRIGNVLNGILWHIEASCVLNFSTYSFSDANDGIQHMADAHATHQVDITTSAKKNYNGNLDDYNVIEGT